MSFIVQGTATFEQFIRALSLWNVARIACEKTLHAGKPLKNLRATRKNIPGNPKRLEIDSHDGNSKPFFRF